MLVYAIAYISAVLLTFMQVLQCLLLMLTSAEYVSPKVKALMESQRVMERSSFGSSLCSLLGV